MERKSNGEGSTRLLESGQWECVTQSKYLNPESLKPKRFKRKADTEQKARKAAKLAMLAWEKNYERVKNTKIDYKKTFGQYMDEFIEEVVKNNVTGSTYKSYIYTLKANFYNCKISKLQLKSLSTVEFEIYYDTLIHNKSKKTASVPIQLTKRCCNWLYGKSLIEDDFASFAKTKKEIKDEFFRSAEKAKEQRKEIFTSDDILKFYQSYKNNVSEYSAAIVLILETMMRGQELLALNIDDIDLEQDIITIKSAVSERFIDNDKNKGLEKYIKVPKNTKTRVIPMTPLAKEIVLYMINQVKMKCRDNSSNLLFPSYLKNGKMRSMDAFEIQFKALCDKLGVDRDVQVRKMPNGKAYRKGLSVHALRHTAITIANTSSNSNVINTALMAGHTAIRTENIYTHTNIDALKSINTAGTTVLGINQKSDRISDDELFAMYQKLKVRFEK